MSAARGSAGSLPAAPARGPRRFALPLALALVLLGLFVLLLWRQAARGPETAAGTGEPSPAAEPVADVQIPYGSPTDKEPFKWPEKPRERHAGEFPRWNLKDFPPGWDAALAGSIHSFFESMEIDPRDVQKLTGLGEIRDEFKEFLSKLGPEAVPTLAAILNAEGDFVHRRFLLVALGELGPRSEEATFALRDFFMARKADPANLSELGHVIKAMGSLQNDSSFEVLTEFVEREDLHAYRGKLVSALGEHPRREEALGILVKTMHDDQTIPARNMAAQALGKIGSPQTLQDLYAAADRETYWVNKQTILGSIGKIGDPSSLPFLIDKARNAKEPAVRLSAGGAIRRVGTRQGEQVLRDLARTEPDAEVRKRFEEWTAQPGAR
jgi:HEAT repeat protein